MRTYVCGVRDHASGGRKSIKPPHKDALNEMLVRVPGMGALLEAPRRSLVSRESSWLHWLWRTTESFVEAAWGTTITRHIVLIGLTLRCCVGGGTREPSFGT